MTRWKLSKEVYNKWLCYNANPFDIVTIKMRIMEKIDRYGSFESYTSFVEWLEELEEG